VAPPLTIGLTGGIAAGKSEALAAFERLGAATKSSDAVVHELLDDPTVQRTLIERWGEEIAADGRVDHGRIGAIVFADPAELAWLESRLHPLVGERLAAWITSIPDETEIAVVEVPLLFETEMAGAFDTTVAVVSDDAVRRERAEARGSQLVDERDARQLAQDEKASRAEHVVRNDGSLEQLQSQLAELVDELAVSRGAGPGPVPD
jgi:dephospho-CoA kinase